MCSSGKSRRDFKSDDSAGGISERSRDVNMSDRSAFWRAFWVDRTEAISSQAPTPSVLPHREISVIVVEERRGARCGAASDAVESFRD